MALGRTQMVNSKLYLGCTGSTLYLMCKILVTVGTETFELRWNKTEYFGLGSGTKGCVKKGNLAINIHKELSSESILWME